MVSVRELCELLPMATTIDVEVAPYQYQLKGKYHTAPLPEMMNALGDYVVERLTETGMACYYIVVKTQPIRKAVDA